MGGERVLHYGTRTSTEGREFVAGLEAVRGIAALSVAVFHCISPIRINDELIFNKTIWQLQGWDQIALRLSAAIFSGSAPVSIFFVLSGFVLFRSLDSASGSAFVRSAVFVFHRFLRIYPAMAINLICMAGLLGLANRDERFFPSWYQPSQGWHELWSNLLLVAPDINGATWTIKIEIEAIPFILIGYYVLKRGRAAALALVIASCSLVFIVPASESSLTGFLFMFYLGMGASHLLKQRQIQWTPCGVVIAICAILFSRAILGYASSLAILLEGAACTYAIVAVAIGGQRLNQYLDTRVLRFCGRISYSFYLYHPLLLRLVGFGIVYRLIPGTDVVSAPFLVVSTIAATLPVAGVSYRYFERPFQRLNRVVAGARFLNPNRRVRHDIPLRDHTDRQ